MVIQHNIPALNSHRNLGINNAKTAKNLEKLSSGYRINRAGDDAAGLAISEKMRGQISGLGMAEQNASNGISLIQTAEGGLNETHSILQRMRELAVQSSNGTYQDEDREQIELEYQALKSEIDRIASYTNYNGIKLLDGSIGGVKLNHASPLTATTTPVKDFGLNDAATVKVLNPLKISGGTRAVVEADILGNLKLDTSKMTAAGSFTVKYASTGPDVTAWSVDDSGANGATLDVSGLNFGDLIDGSGANQTAATAFTVNVDAAGKMTITGISADLTKKNDDIEIDAVVGGTFKAAVNVTTKQAEITGTFTLRDTTSGKDYTFTAESSPIINSNNKNYIQVTNATLGKTMQLDLDDLFTAGDIEAGAVNTTVNFTIDNAGDATATDFPQAQTTYAVTAGYTPRSVADTQRADRMLGLMGIRSNATFDINAALNAAGASSADKTLWESLNGKDMYIISRDSVANTADRGQYRAATDYEVLLQVGDQTYLGTLKGDTLEFSTAPDVAGNTTVVASLKGVTGRPTEAGVISFNAGKTSDSRYTSNLMDKENATIATENVSNLVFQIGANGAEDQRIGMYVFNMSSNNLGDHAKGNFINASTILTRDEANVAVSTIDAAVNYVSSQRANLGALQNRLEHTLNNLGVTKENLSAAESSIRDVDMAKEMMDFTKNNILVQASQAMLAQANSLPQGVLSLLR